MPYFNLGLEDVKPFLIEWWSYTWIRGLDLGILIKMQTLFYGRLKTGPYPWIWGLDHDVNYLWRVRAMPFKLRFVCVNLRNWLLFAQDSCTHSQAVNDHRERKLHNAKSSAKFGPEKNCDQGR